MRSSTSDARNDRPPKRVDADSPAPIGSAEAWSYAYEARPFKSKDKRPGQSFKRPKTIKQYIASEREWVDKLWKHKVEKRQSAMQVDETASSASTIKANPKDDDEIISYLSTEAPPSILPQKKYCDVTGLEAKYVDPRSMLRYHNAEVYEIIKTFQPSVVQTYLSLRGSGLILK